MTKTIKERISKSVKKSNKIAPKKTEKVKAVDWYAKAKASVGISKTDEPLPPRRSR